MKDLQILDYPQRIVIELTPLCNLSCSMCPRHYIEKDEGRMDEKLWKKLINEIAETSPDSVVLPFWRGESLLHTDFVKLIEYALNKNLRIHISTNGHMLTREQLDVLSRCELVTFSIHTMKSHFNAMKLLSYKEDNNPIVQIPFVKGEKTVVKLLNKLITSQDLGGFDSVRTYEEHSKGGIFGKSSYSSANENRKFCPKLENTIVVAYDGSVSRCNHIWITEDGIDLNNISIKDVWSSKLLYKIRSDYPDEYCLPCDQWTGHTCGESWRLVNGRIEYKVFGEAMV